MVILGISALYHDSAAALVRDGRIVAAAQEERFTRIKADKSLPLHAISYCLRAGGNLTGADLDAVVYYDDPILTLHRYCSNLAAVREDPEGLIAFSERSIFSQKLWVEKLLRDHLGMLGKTDQLFITRHHFAHAASAFYPSPFQSAAVITVDGVGEWNTTTIGQGTGNRIRLLKKIDYPHSLGLLYSAFTYFCGFKVNFGDYKLMGLAPYGEPVYADLIRKELIDIKEDGSFRLNLKYFDFQYGRAMTNAEFADLFCGPERKPEEAITKREMDIAASAQQVTEEVMIRMARTAKKLTGEKNLVMAGGVALNCKANGLLVKDGAFENIWVQPAAGDAGGALGAALAFYYSRSGSERTVSLPDAQAGSFLGPEFSNEEIRAYLDENRIPYHYAGDEDLYRSAAEFISEQKVLGVFAGRMEYGPRALGHRSILADARSEKMQSILNLRIKNRESFRPFAPAVLRETCGKYFEPAMDSPYMLFCMDVKDHTEAEISLKEELEADPDLLPIINRRRSDIPAVTHVDYSARVQTVDEKTNPFFYRIIKAFEEKTGCSVVINTSFNVRGEPIVCTPADAYHCFMNTDMDVLMLQNYILYKEEQPLENRRKDVFAMD